MAFSIRNNMVATNAARELDASYGQLGKAVRRLSSGLRISSASDDAAGLAIRELMRADVAVLNQGIRNANDAVSLIQTADSALGIIDEKLIRMKELSEQAATGTYTSTQRVIIDSEFQAMASEINRIARATDFNGIKLLDGSLSGEHDGSALAAKGAMKIHFGTGNDSAEDYYYITIPDSTVESLFHEDPVPEPPAPPAPPVDNEETMDVINATGFDVTVPRTIMPGIGDAEGQNIMALANGNALIAINDHGSTSITLIEVNPAGAEVRRTTAPRVPGVSDIMQPKEIQQLPDGSIVLAYSAWARGASAGSGQQGLHFMRFDQNLNLMGDTLVAPTTLVPDGPEDIGLSVVGNSILGTTIVGTTLQIGMSDLVLGNANAQTLGPGVSATSTALAGRHFVVAGTPAGTLDGYFVGTDGTVQAIGSLGAGLGPKLISFGDRAILSYTKIDADSGFFSTYARVVRSDGSLGEELRINQPDVVRNIAPDMDILRNPDGTLSNQIVIAWRNETDGGTLMAEVFAVGPDAITRTSAPHMTFASKIPGNGLGPFNIAVLADGTIAANWQEDIGGIDDNALGIYRVTGTQITIPVPGVPPSIKPEDPPLPQTQPQRFGIYTQELAQKMLGRVDQAVLRKDTIRAHLGAIQNRLENTISNLQIQSGAVQSAESRISDVDVAIEMTRFIRNQVLTQTATSMLSQANTLTNLVQKILE